MAIDCHESGTLAICGDDLAYQEPDSNKQQAENGLKERYREHGVTLASKAKLGKLAAYRVSTSYFRFVGNVAIQFAEIHFEVQS